MAPAPDREKALEIALAQIDKQYGKGSVMRLGEEGRAPIEVIPTGSIALDVALGIGGLPRGRVIEVYGPESSGKTTIALHAVANAQRTGGIAAFIDAEHALDPDYAKALGVDTDALLVSQPDTGEQALEIADMLIRSGALDVVVIDSVAALVPRAEIEGEMGDAHVGLQARLMSQALRKITGALSNSGTTMIFINQLREKVGVFFGSPETTTGGKALKFYASVRLDIRRIETLKDGSDAVGNRTRVKVVKNKCVAAGTRVFDPVTGQTHLIEDVVDGRLPVHVVAADKVGMLHSRPVVSWFDQGEQDVMGLRLRDGTELWVTPDHKILTESGWCQAGQLAAGDRVARPRKFLGFGDAEPIAPEHARGMDNVTTFAEAVPMWEPRGQVLTRELTALGGRYRGSQSLYLASEVYEPVLAHLADRRVTPQLAAKLIGDRAGNPQGGMRQVLGLHRLRRDRLSHLADALDDAFLRKIVAEELYYSRIVAILPSRRCRTFDIEVDELHNFVANDVVVHNCAPPFKQAEFDILYGHGISKEGSLIDLGVEQGVVRKSGSWYTYEGDQLGQGKENARKFLGDNPDIAAEIEKRIKDKLGIGAKLDADQTVPAPVDF
jgi:protein RecA